MTFEVIVLRIHYSASLVPFALSLKVQCLAFSVVGLTTQSNVKSDLHVLYTRDSTATLELFFIAGVGLGATLSGYLGGAIYAMNK